VVVLARRYRTNRAAEQETLTAAEADRLSDILRGGQ
jgi:hypothetical protein